MFLLKKIIGTMLLPLPVCLILLIAGLMLLWFTKRHRAGKIMVTFGVVLLILFSYEAFSNRLLRPLEYRYPPLISATSLKSLLQGNPAAIRWIVVLGGGHVPDPLVPSSTHLSHHALVRLVEGIHLHRTVPGCKLVLSGGAIFSPIAEAQTLAKVARSLGVAEEDLVLETESKDTEDEARLIQPIVGNDRFILVTSASHMPRSVALFEKRGMHPIPAPTDYGVKTLRKVGYEAFFPQAKCLSRSQDAFHEYLGIAWGRLRGLI